MILERSFEAFEKDEVGDVEGARLAIASNRTERRDFIGGRIDSVGCEVESEE